MSHTHSGKFNLLMNYILLAANYLFPMITFPYVTRVLGAEALGRVGFASSIANYFAAFATFGITSYAVRTCARVKDDQKEFSRTASEMFTANGFTTAIAGALFLIAIFTIPVLRSYWQFMLIFGFGMATEFIGISWYYTSTEQFSYITTRGIALKLLTMAGLFLAIHDPSDALLYAGLTVGSATVINLVNYLYARRKTVIKLQFNSGFFKHYAYTKWFFFQSIALTLLSNMDVSMLGILSTEAHVGYYEVALKLKTLTSALVSSLGTVFLPRLSREYARKDMDAFLRTIYKSISYNCVLSFAAVGVCLVNAEDVITLFCGDAYAFSADILKVIMPAVILIGISTVTGIQVLISVNEEKGVFLSLLTGGLVNLILNIRLIPMMQGVGAAIATVCSEGVILIVQLLWMRKIKLSLPVFRYIWKPAAGFLVATAASMLLQSGLQGQMLVRLIMSAGCFGIVYLIVLLVFREEILLEILNILIWRRYGRKD